MIDTYKSRSDKKRVTPSVYIEFERLIKEMGVKIVRRKNKQTNKGKIEKNKKK